MRHVDLKLETEMRRGIFQLAVLSLLMEPAYGYQIGRHLSEQGLAVEEGTLYPLLRRMEEQGLLESWWATDQPRPRKYYRTTEDGKKSLANLLEVWGRVDAALRRILESSKAAGSGAGATPPAPGPAAAPPRPTSAGDDGSHGGFPGTSRSAGGAPSPGTGSGAAGTAAPGSDEGSGEVADDGSHGGSRDG